MMQLKCVSISSLEFDFVCIPQSSIIDSKCKQQCAKCIALLDFPRLIVAMKHQTSTWSDSWDERNLELICFGFTFERPIKKRWQQVAGALLAQFLAFKENPSHAAFSPEIDFWCCLRKSHTPSLVSPTSGDGRFVYTDDWADSLLLTYCRDHDNRFKSCRPWNWVFLSQIWAGSTRDYFELLIIFCEKLFEGKWISFMNSTWNCAKCLHWTEFFPSNSKNF